MRNGNHISTLVLCLLAILPLIPASCTIQEDTPVDSSLSRCLLLSPTGASSFSIDSTYSFIYDSNGYLDSYQIDRYVPGVPLELACRTGNKKIAIMSNVSGKNLYFDDIRHFNGLTSIKASLADDDPNRPLSCTSFDFNFGTAQMLYIPITPVMAKITIRHFSVNFSDRAYYGATLESPKVYLINANGRCCILPGKDGQAEDIINQGAFNAEQTFGIRHPEMLFSENISEASLCCYPCDGRNVNDPGQCTTRMVIEGKIFGVTYYYPINVGNGLVERGKEYVYDISITRAGGSDPDCPLENDVACISFIVKEWEEYDNEVERY